MAERTIVLWRDIPAQVVVKAGRKSARRQLSDRFQAAIDRAAMRAKLTGTDAYLAEWRRIGEPCSDDLEAEAEAAAAALESAYDDARLSALIAGYGHEQNRPLTPIGPFS